MPKSVIIGDTSYDFPDEYDNSQIQGILRQQGILPKPKSAEEVMGILRQKYGNALDVSSDPSNAGVALEVLKGFGKAAVNPLQIGAEGSPLVVKGPGQEFGADVAMAPAVAQGVVGAAKGLSGVGSRVVDTIRNPIVRKEAVEAIPNWIRKPLKAVGQAWKEAGPPNPPPPPQVYNPVIPPQPPVPPDMPPQAPPKYQPSAGVRRSMPTYSPSPSPYGGPSYRLPPKTPSPLSPDVPPQAPTPTRPSPQTILNMPKYGGASSSGPPGYGNIPKRLPGTTLRGAPIPLEESGTAAVSPGGTPPSPPNPTPASVKVPGAVPQTASSPAAEELKNLLGGEPGKPLVIPGSDTTDAGTAIRNANSVLKSLREQGHTPDMFKGLPEAERSKAVELVNTLTDHPLTRQTIIDKLGLSTPASTPTPGGELGKFARGGVVVPPANGPKNGTVLNTVKGEDKAKTVLNTVKGEDKAKIIPELARTGEDIIRGTSNIPLSSKGEAGAKELGKRFASRGGVDSLETSDLKRSVQTADAISKATGVPISKKGADLHPWHLGELEGQPTLKVLDRIHRYITKQPNVEVPGMGPESTGTGESFNSFKRRLLGTIKGKMQELKRDPSKRIALVTHYRDVRLVQAWAARGFPDSMEINSKFMLEKGSDPPGSVYRMYWKGAKPALARVNMQAGGNNPGGVYLVRHESTKWNAENYEGGDGAGGVNKGNKDRGF